MEFRVQVGLKPGLFDSRGAALVQSAANLGIGGVREVSVQSLYFLEGNLGDNEVERLCRELLCDPIVQSFLWRPSKGRGGKAAEAAWAVEVTSLPGVADSVAESALLGARVMGIEGLRSVKTGQRYLIWGELGEAGVREIAEKLLHNPVIQRYSLGELSLDFSPIPAQPLRVQNIPLTQASDGELEELSQRGMLALDLAEMRAIRDYFRGLGRDPTDVELETLAQTWSEHCVHKSFKALVDYEEWEGKRLVKREEIPGILRTYLMAATNRVNAPWLISVFVDNAGIVEFDDDYEISFKVETHNHPSALEPFGGANTGTGGVLRDIIGVSAKPIAATDILCFGPLDLAFSELPREVLHPRRLYEGVVAGIMDYGNKFGVPTLNGAILFHPGYIGNPLVFCGAVGIAPRGRHRRSPQAGDKIVLVGGRTGRDGIHGVTMASAEITERTGREAGSAVQIGNPITEKKFHDVILRARDEGHYSAITDCGGGGLSSAVGEMGRDLGARVDLALVPLKYQGLEPWEVWISEAQERMVLAVPPANLERIIGFFAQEDVEATPIGEFTGDKELRLYWGERLVGELSMEFLHGGCPQRRLSAIWRAPNLEEPDFPQPDDLAGELKAILACPNVASKEAVIRRYDHEVQGGTVVKPLLGEANDGPSDGAVIKPLFHSPRGAIITNAINPLYGAIDPYWMAASGIDEALRNLVALGGDIGRAAILDNFCWGNPHLPDQMGALVRAAKACYDMAIGYGVPFISGKDSLNNEYRDTQTGKLISIPPTLLISALGVIPDVRQAVTMDLKRPGDALYLVGMTRPELGGSHYYMWKGLTGRSVPRVDPALGREIMLRLYQAVSCGLVRASHDLSEGGLGVAASEMAFAGSFGLEVNLRRVPREEVERDDHLLFSESNTRFLVEVAPADAPAFEGLLEGLPCACIGRVVDSGRLTVIGLGGRGVLSAGLSELKAAWQNTLGEGTRA